MGALAPETDMLCPNDYATLGLKDSIHGSLKKPHILSLIATFLESGIHKNERILESSQAKDVITVFHGLRAPTLSIQQYLERIYKYSCCSPSCFVIAHVYMDRYIERTNMHITSLNIHRLIITSVMVAAKFMDDAFFNNAYYARVGGISTSELNKLETKFLFGLDFRLYISVHTFGKYCSMLKQQASAGLVERPLKACVVKESWANKDDVCSEPIAR